jgi:hypothetical protein
MAKTWLTGMLIAVARDGAGLAGVGLISYGAWLVYPPAGFIIAGAMLLAGALLTGRKVG